MPSCLTPGGSTSLLLIVRAFRKLVTLLKPGGLLAVTLRHGPDDGRGAYEVNGDEIEALARNHGMEVALRLSAYDTMGKLNVR